MIYRFVEMKGKDLKTALQLFNYYVENSTALWTMKKTTMKEFREIISYKVKKYRSYKVVSGKEFYGFFAFKQYNKREGYDRTAEISIYLKPELTGRGIGLNAVRFLEKQAKKAGIKVLVASISGDNKGSISLFKKAGYKKCAHYRQTGEKFGRILDGVGYQKIIAKQTGKAQV